VALNPPQILKKWLFGFTHFSMKDTTTRFDREENTREFKPFVLWFTGLSASGKTTLANLLHAELAKAGFRCFVLDGDRLRSGLCSDLGFSATDRAENLRRAGEVARLLVNAGLVVIAAFISPYVADRARVRSRFDKDQFYEVFLDCPIEVCRQRDPKGLYRKAQEGLIPAFTGVSDPYEPPNSPDLVIQTGELTAQQSLEALHRFCLDRCLTQENLQ
jgi:adenylyl-sulfate kinase